MPTLDRVAGRATWLLSRANARAHSLLAAAFASEGMRGYHFRVLAALDQYGPSSQAELGRYAGIDRSDIVATLNDLLARHLVERRPDAADRRRNIVLVTKQGKRTLERLDKRLDDVQEDVLAPLNSRERSALVRLLAKLDVAGR
jgi:DNA-binding MarR family transcriptional regulator